MNKTNEWRGGGHEGNELKKGGVQMKHKKKKLSGVTYTIYIQGVPKKRGISECHSVCSTAQLMLSLEFLFPIHLNFPRVDLNKSDPT